MLQVTYFYDSVAMDVDNIVKPIQDAIIGLAYNECQIPRKNSILSFQDAVAKQAIYDRIESDAVVKTKLMPPLLLHFH
ncbi:hypothetical protein [Myxosarcina sp. GI1]|uniref:hypothetical protein n=1 Tax=Myxosarcina sp. GI1 TaxID=1541065 RepID=UPI0020A182D2|nr:hypothetical protein [Myxosarcina sp. GI1]